ncbi:integral membrane protein-like protein [Periconia macrospinosa]|uniref:Integral membrane protein-like protein n=1 Tax=Periconia macrospinosa TaxID=97972 RepID=A0A2V1E9Q1_9PLEO|nr:integral membrane protein-like protein [Periconia macrospinosa]
MASPEAQDVAAKQRIVNHMNADHSDSVRRYLEAFSGMGSYQVRNARMTDITLNDMKFDCCGQQVTIPLDPPMKSYREARERAVQLDKDALRLLGRSDITITKYIPPWVHLGHLFNFTTCLITYGLFSRPSHFQPGSVPHDMLLHHVPKFTKFCLTIQPYLITIMAAIHAFETVLMVRKLRRHSLTLFDGVFWAWCASAFVEGITAFQRLDTFIANKQSEKEAKKH